MFLKEVSNYFYKIFKNPSGALKRAFSRFSPRSACFFTIALLQGFKYDSYLYFVSICLILTKLCALFNRKLFFNQKTSKGKKMKSHVFTCVGSLVLLLLNRCVLFLPKKSERLQQYLFINDQENPPTPPLFIY